MNPLALPKLFASWIVCLKRSMADVGSFPLAIRRLSAYGLFTLLCLPFYAAAMAFKGSLPVCFLHLYHRACLWILGIKLEVSGMRSQVQPTLFVANHAGYIDIPILGALVPGSFIAKSEVSLWPVFGILAKLQRTVFIDRNRDSIRTQQDAIGRRLLKGDPLILFPEGTSGDGNRVLPFKSTLFSVSVLKTGQKPLTVQPISIAYTKLDGIPLGRSLRPLLAWYGDMALAPHLIRLAGLRRITVSVTFHSPVTLHTFGNRKVLADHCQTVIAEGVSASLTGRASPGEGLGPPFIGGDPQ